MTNPINEGIYTKMPIEEYHADKESLSRSSLLDFDRSPFNYWANHVNPDRPEKERTRSMLMGSAFHCMILEPDEFKHQYIVSPEPVKLKDVGRVAYEAYKEIVAECESTMKSIIPWDMYLELRNMRDRFRENKNAVDLIDGAAIENSLFWRDDHSGLMLKARPDAYHSAVIIDLKTISDASPRNYQAEMIKHGYHIQGAMCQDALEILTGDRIQTVINIVIENKYPYAMGIYKIDEFALEEGQRKYKQICLDLKNARLEDKWQDYGVQTISLPKWAL
jgi:hypothetical protein